jgi:hypothetical protein
MTDPTAEIPPELFARLAHPTVRLSGSIACRSKRAWDGRGFPCAGPDRYSVGVEDHLISGDLLASGGQFVRCRVIWISGRRQVAELHQAGHQQ